MSSEYEQLLAEMAKLKARLSVYEGIEQKQEDEEERKRALEIFKTFDTDNSNDIDVTEFQELSYQLGETLTRQQAAAVVRTIDTDRKGTISFEAFFKWWKSTARQQLSDSGQADNASLALKAKLTSKSYMRAVTQLVQTAKKLDEAKSADSQKSKDMVSTNTVVTVGELEHSAAAITVSFAESPTETAHERTVLNADESDTVISIGFVVRESAGAFGAGEIVGQVKLALGAVTDKAGIALLKTEYVAEGDLKVAYLHFAIKAKANKMIPQIYELLGVVQVAHANLKVEFSSRPNKKEDEPLGIRATLKSEANKTALLALAKEKNKTAKSGSFLADPLLSTDIEIELDDLDQFAALISKDILRVDSSSRGGRGRRGRRSAYDSDDEEDANKQPVLLNWGLGTKVLQTLLGKMLKERAPEPKIGVAALLKAAANLHGLHLIRVLGGNFVLKAECKNLFLFDAVPNKQDFAAQSGNGSDSD
jgi:hypothetical protein